MPRPLTPNDEARAECVMRLAGAVDTYTQNAREDEPLAFRAASVVALRAIGQMLTRMDMDDICIGIDRLLHGDD